MIEPFPPATRSTNILQPDRFVVRNDAQAAPAGAGSRMDRIWSVANGRKYVSPAGSGVGSRLVIPFTPAPVFSVACRLTRQLAASYRRWVGTAPGVEANVDPLKLPSETVVGECVYVNTSTGMAPMIFPSRKARQRRQPVTPRPRFDSTEHRTDVAAVPAKLRTEVAAVIQTSGPYSTRLPDQWPYRSW